MRKCEVAILCFAAMCAGLTPAFAEAGSSQVRFGLVYSSPTDDLVDGMQTTELDGALGFQAGYEYMLTELIGIEPAVGYTSYDLSVEEPGFPDVDGDVDLVAVATSLNFHFVRDGGLDLYVGPTIGYALWGDIDLDGFPMSVSTDDEFVFGANLGLDRPIGESGWRFSAGVSYLAVDLAASGGDIGVSPVQIRVGCGYSF